MLTSRYRLIRTSLKRSLQAGLTFLLLLLSAEIASRSSVYSPSPQPPTPAPISLQARTTPPLSQTTVYVNPATGTDTASGPARLSFRTITHAPASQTRDPNSAGTVIIRLSGETFPLVLTPGISLRATKQRSNRCH